MSGTPRGAPPLDRSAEVAAALADGRPVVALESTILAHGLPRPDNRAAAGRLEAAVRAAGAVPATVAVLDGRLKAGLSAAELDRICNAPGLAKLSSRDLGPALAAGGSGATTVAATMTVAHAAGIAVFATGGIGGVHRGAEHSFDVSADLAALARIPVAVVAAGAKAILDLPRTLEMLETLGVPVAGYGTDRFPAFWCRDSGLAVPHRADAPAAMAALLRAHWSLPSAGGVLVANPCPEAAALDRTAVETAIAAALAAAEVNEITGPAVTPFLLARVVEATGGASLAANLALAEANARLAGAIAGALAGGA